MPPNDEQDQQELTESQILSSLIAAGEATATDLVQALLQNYSHARLPKDKALYVTRTTSSPNPRTICFISFHIAVGPRDIQSGFDPATTLLENLGVIRIITYQNKSYDLKENSLGLMTSLDNVVLQRIHQLVEKKFP